MAIRDFSACEALQTRPLTQAFSSSLSTFKQLSQEQDQPFAASRLQPASQKILGSISVQIYFESQIRIDLPACLRSDNNTLY